MGKITLNKKTNTLLTVLQSKYLIKYKRQTKNLSVLKVTVPSNQFSSSNYGNT